MPYPTPYPSELSREAPRRPVDEPRLATIRRRLNADLAPRGMIETRLVERISLAVERLGDGDGDLVELGSYGRAAMLIRDRRYLCTRDMVMRYGGRDANDLWHGLKSLRILQQSREAAMGNRPDRLS